MNERVLLHLDHARGLRLPSYFASEMPSPILWVGGGDPHPPKIFLPLSRGLAFDVWVACLRGLAPMSGCLRTVAPFSSVGCLCDRNLLQRRGV